MAFWGVAAGIEEPSPDLSILGCFYSLPSWAVGDFAFPLLLLGSQDSEFQALT